MDTECLELMVDHGANLSRGIPSKPLWVYALRYCKAVGLKMLCLRGLKITKGSSIIEWAMKFKEQLPEADEKIRFLLSFMGPDYLSVYDETPLVYAINI
jgi:hypothetical protein